MKKRLLFAVALLAASACSETPHDKKFYMMHKPERLAKLAECRQPALSGTPNCHAANSAEIAEMFGLTDKEKS